MPLAYESPSTYADLLESRFTLYREISLPFKRTARLWAFQNVPFSPQDDILTVLENAAVAAEEFTGAPIPDRRYHRAVRGARRRDRRYRDRVPQTHSHTGCQFGRGTLQEQSEYASPMSWHTTILARASAPIGSERAPPTILNRI